MFDPVILRKAPAELMPVPAKESASAPMLMLPPALLVVSSKAPPLTITVPPAVVPKPLLLPTRMAPALLVRFPVKVLVPLRKRVAAPDLVMFDAKMIPLRMMLPVAVLMLAVPVAFVKVMPKLIVWVLVEKLVRTPALVRIKALAVLLVPVSTNAPALLLNAIQLLTLAVPLTARLFTLFKRVLPANRIESPPSTAVPPAQLAPVVQFPFPKTTPEPPDHILLWACASKAAKKLSETKSASKRLANGSECKMLERFGCVIIFRVLGCTTIPPLRIHATRSQSGLPGGECSEG